MSSGTLATSVWDNRTLDVWEIPFGRWVEEIVFWLTTHIKGFLDAVKWPVDQLLELIIDNLLQSWLPSPIVLLLFFLLGLTTRNALVGLGSAAGLLVCGLLGNEYWDLTMETVGMIIVAVIICTVIGIPLGMLAARVDSFWGRLRPVLDGMQVIHPFVYLLPIIFLFGVRRTPGVLATLVFALPPSFVSPTWGCVKSPPTWSKRPGRSALPRAGCCAKCSSRWRGARLARQHCAIARSPRGCVDGPRCETTRCIRSHKREDASQLSKISQKNKETSLLHHWPIPTRQTCMAAAMCGSGTINRETHQCTPDEDDYSLSCS